MANKMINVTFRMDKKDKQEFENVIHQLGLNLSSAFNIFAKAVVRESRIPFELKAKIPNEETLQAMRNAENDENMEEFTLEELIKEYEAMKRQENVEA
ncbi:type II toxin-antitoxin system RelB/DinJ family antitoxin [Helicobacter sp. MIT 14-3879]|uniref:type II toxin-antitoxin system RelB/DinJ family antitoxin n=1 Tax=Helicobacter sp. MIT 14-3879 TaxID=2040649 RepID=UPI000E1F842C|nr:type II toxin-antitoxin system RelB/DinJ family antitoxin [Helicobacter sp. MIT 14-3879]RDU60645.1 type II toxin-antitoxin system antitoxin, RelB/DinJ family [Helicobacter sp. MIT 14-3879]